MKPSIRPLITTWAPFDNLLRTRAQGSIIRPPRTAALTSSATSSLTSMGPMLTARPTLIALQSSMSADAGGMCLASSWHVSSAECRNVTRSASTLVTAMVKTTEPARLEACSSFLRTFSTSSLAPIMSALSAPSSMTSLLLSKMPRLRSQDIPGRMTSRERRRASALLDRSKRPPSASGSTANASAHSRGGGGGGGPPQPWRQPRSSTAMSSLGSLIALSDQRLFSHLPANFVLYTIIALNVLVFVGWMYASESLRRFSDPRAYIFLSKNFLSGLTNVSDGRWWTMLTSCVSHEELNHFLLNMVSLAFMAPPVLALTGPTTFILLYFGAGMVSSIVSMIGKALVPPATQQKRGSFSHGASGSVYAIMSTFACVHPTATFLIFFVIPAPAWACVSGIFAWDLWHAAKTPKGRTDSAGHVGGILAGILFWRFGLRGVRLR